MSASEITLLYSLLLVFALVLIIVLTFIYSYIRHQKRLIKLQKELLTAETQTLEKERKRMARDLHDDMGPLLTAVVCNLDALNPIKHDEILVLDKAVDQLNIAIKEIRNISHNLSPAILEREGMVEAIANLANRLDNPGKINVLFSSDIDAFSMDKDQELNIYRIVEEVLNNAVKHSGANSLEVSLTQRNNKYFLIIKDNGKGFHYQKTSEGSQGLGLKNILSRINLLNADIHYDSPENKGTTVTIKIPM